MAAGAILLSFLYLLLYIAGICIVAYAIVWLIKGFLGWSIDANVYKWGQIFVGLLIIIAIVAWILSVVGVGGGPIYFPHGYQH
jgi:hypothetical protein